MKFKLTKWDRKRQRDHAMKSELRRRLEVVIAAKLETLSPEDQARVIRGEMPLFDITNRKGA